MIIAIDFDGTVVEQDGKYSDTKSPLKLKPGAREALESLKRAGHVLLLWSGRNNRSRQYLPEFDPLVRTGDVGRYPTDESRMIEANRYRQMVEFCDSQLPGIFNAIDDGRQGKPAADLFIDDKAIRFGGPDGMEWKEIAGLYGE